mmetsp:Transcript_24631/g.26951  ORF Transcript_24631/g.26951 Transcript_24631/m.26951 type:complete len:131 (+) Transcript_24631:206-598(+)|eukprot:CAMPEP_0173137926 /NCGR_PEP_ID=MMETSP1105-20130129/3383_1 /TAXON_ID=2985 /ORGANISM="Ochromonas sp., Strain BG-1" /LENGTH=130 /DNA_ID=CAMNT_0014050419 /DNA_START=108 /DNA_END=500 /DNA_ORIENTATION=-
MTNITCIPLHDPTVIMVDCQVQTFQDTSEASDKLMKLQSLAVAVPKLLPAATNDESSTQSTYTVAAASVTPLTNSDTVIADIESGELMDMSDDYSYERQIKVVFWVIVISFFVVGGAVGVMVAFVVSVPK